MPENPKVVVLGGGFGGLEAAFYLRHVLDDKARLTIVSDHEYFLFKPNTIYIPFGEDPEKFKIDLAKPTKRKDIELIQDRAVGVDPDNRKALLENGEVDYDFLVVATGAGMRAAASRRGKIGDGLLV